MDAPVPELEARARACADALLEAEEVLLASHIDADGLTSAAVAATALRRAEIPFETVFEKQLDADSVAGIAARDGVGVQLFLEDRLEGNPGAPECRRGDGGARQAVGVDVRGQQHAVGLEQRIGTRPGARLEFRKIGRASCRERVSSPV